MAPGADDPTCHLLRLPYELLKPVLSMLNQKDQLSASKTCVHLWELAYPMVYNRITVRIGPDLKDSAWSNLASGVGFRYVQHLKILSLYGDSNKPRNIEDLIAGTLVAALRRNQLLSFQMSSELCSLGTISMKTVVVLLETQQMLECTDIPQVIESGTALSHDQLKSAIRPSKLRKVSCTFATSLSSNLLLHDIIEDHLCSSYLHVRCHSVGSVYRQVFPSIFEAPRPAISPLLHCLTRLTLRGYHFQSLFTDSAPLFPTLRALAVIDCQGDVEHCLRLKAINLPCLEALMVLAEEGRGRGDYATFIEHLHPLKELILRVPFVWLDDGSSLLPHAQSLELFCAHSGSGHRECEIFAFSGSGLDVVCQLENLRHLSLFVYMTILGDESGNQRVLGDSLLTHLNELANCEHLRSINLRCNVHLSEPRHKLDLAGLIELDHGSRLEEAFGKLLTKDISDENHTAQAAPSLEHLAVAAVYKLFPHYIHPSCKHLLGVQPEREKHMYSLKPKLKFRPATEVKKEMMERYAEDGYHFLEEYIDAMMKTSEVVLTEPVLLTDSEEDA